MSALTIYSDKDASKHLWHSTDAAEIAQQLNAKGVRFERWVADRDLGATLPQKWSLTLTSMPSTSWSRRKAIRAGM